MPSRSACAKTGPIGPSQAHVVSCGAATSCGGLRALRATNWEREAILTLNELARGRQRAARPSATPVPGARA
eukprot:3833462-Lingulodinium_polyedra.AAC.1